MKANAVENGTRTSDDMEAIRQDVATLRADLMSLMGSLREDGRDQARDLKMRILETTRRLERHARDRFRGLYGQARDKGALALEAGRHKIEERPLTIVLGALGVGLLLGKLWRRR